MSTPSAIPSSEPGFIRVACTACNNPDVWFKCNGCGKSDRFAMREQQVVCTCGETYASGICTCGQTVPFAQLQRVDFDKGPMALADLEVAWGRVAGIVVGLVLVLGSVGYLVFGR